MGRCDEIFIRGLAASADKRATGAQADAGAFSAVQAAFEALRDPACRRQYDRELRERQAALEVSVWAIWAAAASAQRGYRWAD